MNATIKQLLLLLLFFCILGSVFIFRAYQPPPEPKLNREDSLKRYGFFFEEVSESVGLKFVHKAPVLDSKLEHIMPIVAGMGAGVSIVDFDKDGWPDIYVVNSGPASKNALFRNKGMDKDGKPRGFEDVGDKYSVASLNQPGDGACMGAVWGDFDNDGYEDLFVYRWGKPELFKNKGKNKEGEHLGFERVSEIAHLPKWVNAGNAIWLDFDGDGLLDLLIGGYWADDIDLWNLKTTKIMPQSFEYAKNGGRRYLLRNRGMDRDGRWLGFEDVTERMGLTSTRWVLAAAATDLSGSGYPDLVLAIDYGVNEFYANQGGKKFVDRSKESRIGDRPKSGMSVSLGDVYNQGRFCIYTTNITEPNYLLQWNNLWVPQRGMTGNDLAYDNLAESLGVAKGGWSWGAQFGDLNNDGKLDLFLTNGNVTGEHDASYWYAYSQIAGVNTLLTSDAARWPAMEGKSLSGKQPKCVWLNRGGKFDDVALATGVTDLFDGRAVAMVDLWNRGVLDVVLANQKAPLLVYKNTVAADNAWIQFELIGLKSNKSAIGAQLTLFWNDESQVQEVSGGSGYSSQNQRRLHFGLGKNPHVDRAEIRWPSGKRQTLKTPEIRKLHQITEAP